MGNITQLSQGSLDGLKKQVCECIDHAHAQGYKKGYNVGFEIGKKQAISEIPEIANNENEMYNRGYNTAIDDYNMMIEWWNNNSEDFGKFLFEVYGLADCRYKSISLLCDIICSWDMREVIDEFKKWQEQKKQAEEEIKVGDEVKDLATDNIGVVMAIGNLILYITNNGVYSNTLGSLEKTGRHFDEVSQLLDKLKGDNNESNN